MDYKEKYEQAIEALRSLIAEQAIKHCDRVSIKDITNIFPELKESESIRLWLIDLLSTMQYHHCDEDMEMGNKALAWLEKQGEHANFRNKIQIGDKVTRNEDGVLVNLSQLNRVAKKDEKQGKHGMGISEATKQKLEDNLHKALEKETPESLNEFLDEQGEQKPAEEYNITGIGSKNAKGKLGEMIKNLKPVNEVLEQKPVWSEEDSNMLEEIVKSLKRYQLQMPNYRVELQMRWLKSLKERYTWEPSDEQMKILNEVLNFAANHESPHWNDYIFGTLHNLIIQLKKLREK